MNQDLTTGKPSRVLWKFCLPLFGSIIFQQLYNIADSFVAGKFISENALAAVGNSYEITLIFIAFAFGCNIGCSVVAAQFFGAKDLRSMKTTIYTTLIASAGLCAVLMLVGLLLSRQLLGLINTPDEIMKDSQLYLNIYICGLPFVFFYNVATGIFSALGDSKTPFFFLMASSLSNIAVDILFVTAFGMGVDGVAWATFLCQGVSCVLALVFVFLYAPIVLLIVFSFNSGNSNMVWKGFSLHWYTKLFRNRIIMQSVYTTLLVSLLATIIATVAGTFAAIGFYAMRRRVRNPLMTVNNIPMMNADIVTGVSMCLLFVAFFSGWGSFASWFNTLGLFRLPTHLTMGFGTLLIAHITFNIPYVILSVGPKLRQMDRNLVDAAMDLGCTWMQAFQKVIIPEIKPGIVSGALTAFTMSIDDFVISYFTAGSSASTLAMTIYGMTKKKVTPEINAISTLLFVTVLILLAVINLREARQERKRIAEAAHK